MNADGTNQVRLTTGSQDDDYGSFSASKIAFLFQRQGNMQVFTMDPNGANQVNISNNNFNDTQPCPSRA